MAETLRYLVKRGLMTLGSHISSSQKNVASGPSVRRLSSSAVGAARRVGPAAEAACYHASHGVFARKDAGFRSLDRHITRPSVQPRSPRGEEMQGREPGFVVAPPKRERRQCSVGRPTASSNISHAIPPCAGGNVHLQLLFYVRSLADGPMLSRAPGRHSGFGSPTSPGDDSPF